MAVTVPIIATVPDTELLHLFVDLLVKAKEHGKIRAKEGPGTTNEAFAHGQAQRAVREIEKHLDPSTTT